MGDRPAVDPQTDTGQTQQDVGGSHHHPNEEPSEDVKHHDHATETRDRGREAHLKLRLPHCCQDQSLQGGQEVEWNQDGANRDAMGA